MKVITVREKTLDLCESPVRGSPIPISSVQDRVKLTGAAVFDDEERLLPLVSGFLSHGLRNSLISEQSALTYGRNLGYVYEYLGTRREFKDCERDSAFLEIRAHVIEEYFARLREIEEISKKTVRNRDSSLMAFFTNFLCRGLDDLPPPRSATNPYASGMLSPRPNKSLVVACSLSDLKELILATQSERERCLLQFIYDTGIRRSEVPRVTLKAIDDALQFQDTLFITTGVTAPINADYCPIRIDGSKGPANSIKPRDSLVSRATLLRVKKYHASPLYKMYKAQFSSPETTPAFLNAKGNVYTPRSISKLLERVSKRAMVRMRIDRQISPHKLRHGNAYALLRTPDIGADYLDRLVAVQKTLGHSQLQTSEIYTQIPYDLYQKLIRPGAEAKTKAGEMLELSQQTRLKINAGDSK
ncbi:tyrosine-type recombinase/integrase [Pseudomonas sp. YQ_6]|uniref:tyrosine-type recombinase/integrase n=1 Tax=unclassified Pseudomonas TaxID=196821 RepID=UPI002567BE78|nr:MULTISPECIES: tyrosine-type recombinase/integrase [unclassified Pseudomonas]EKT4493113.1 tyrosine-type recombinase/integrase [Pseudomonas putida]EKT8864091.1 tyrosine-type recombinase/integrase [Pseudomonas putida]